jgi:hypothetical protein
VTGAARHVTNSCHYVTDVLTLCEMSSDDEALPHADDNDYWPVSEITGERPREYRVKWEGINPETGEPWEESWVPKRDCTADLVEKWKRSRASDKASGWSMFYCSEH